MLALNSTSGLSPARESKGRCQEKQRETTICYQTTPKCSPLSNRAENRNSPSPRDTKYFNQNYDRIPKKKNQVRVTVPCSSHLYWLSAFPLNSSLSYKIILLEPCRVVAVLSLKVFVRTQANQQKNAKSKPRDLRDLRSLD